MAGATSNSGGRSRSTRVRGRLEFLERPRRCAAIRGIAADHPLCRQIQRLGGSTFAGTGRFRMGDPFRARPSIPADSWAGGSRSLCRRGARVFRIVAGRGAFSRLHHRTWPHRHRHGGDFHSLSGANRDGVSSPVFQRAPGLHRSARDRACSSLRVAVCTSVEPGGDCVARSLRWVGGLFLYLGARRNFRARLSLGGGTDRSRCLGHFRNGRSVVLAGGAVESRTWIATDSALSVAAPTSQARQASRRGRFASRVSAAVSLAQRLARAFGWAERRALDAPIEALRRTGYRTVYLSSCDTRAYGLRELLERAGFECVLDSAALRNGSRASISDADLLTHGWHHLARLLTDGRPWFLHVHTNNTHVPYRLSDPASFQHFDSATDLGRFLNGLEEADSHLSQFASKLADLGQTGAPLLVVSADHGQSFGQFGYHSHGSAVVKEQVMVPCVISHPRLKPQAIPYSSHLDVLPTVLDLLGIETARPTFGSSMLGSRARPCWLLWAGHPSRSRTSHFGLVKDQKKYMFDWTVNRGFELAWDDQCARELFGEEKKHYGALISKIARDLGVE